ncbi:UPF0481 protein At3g47200-like [Quercus robur]|uniref:UPF0481 protein At3g47200-like n=1 Tax=Quercus robur TaxID=38942 RepID=UPI0021628B1A|nr:UPF0481 protein At3g47200-like [Quercus robur]
MAMPIWGKKDTIIDVTQAREPNWDPKCCIYRVPQRLRNVNKNAYTPKLISIGPVHRNNGELKDMQMWKESYLKEFFSRISKAQKEFACIIEKNEDEIRRCYAVEISLPEKKDFVRMILLDSIFIIELFLRNEDQKYGKDYILSKQCLKDGIMQDLILLENQLPFFILDRLYDQSGITGCHKCFLTLACKYFFDRKKLPTDKELSTDEMKGVKHFTDLYRQFYHPPKHGIIGDQNTDQQPHSATKLDNAGLKLEKWEPNDQKQKKYSLEEKRCLLDIQFKPSSACCPRINCPWPTVCLKKFPSLKHFQIRLVIPEFVVHDRIEEIFRNLMALEQCHYPDEAYICNYIELLDFLINREEDVELLVDKKIIVNSLGSNRAVAKMINNLCREIVGTKSYYSEVTEKLDKYYNSSWNKNMASLRNVYFRDIWRSTATVVGFVVVLVTILNFLRPFVFTNT